MATNFPTTVDTFTNPVATDQVSVVDHAVQHTHANDAVLALETKVGVDSSAVATTLDYKLKNTASIDPGHKHTEASLNTSDITTNNVVSTKHGYAPKSPADATQFLNGAATPAYAQVKDSDLATTDVTTNNVSSAKHGFAPKGDGTTTKFLNANGAYSTPAAGSQFSTTQVFTGTSPGTTWTDLDLSSVVGATQKMVMLVIKNNDGSARDFYFKRKGISYTMDVTSSTPVGVHGATVANSGKAGMVIVSTDANGVIQWYSSSAVSANVYVEAYW